MNNPIIISDFYPELLQSSSGNAFVIKTTNPELFQDIYKLVNQNNKLHCIYFSDLSKSLSSIDFKPEWTGIPISVFVRVLGELKQLLPKLGIIRSLNLRLFLPAHPDENLTSIKILSSLGIPTGVFFIKGEKINWSLLNDLMYYYFYTINKHADIEPFKYIADHYHHTHINFNAVYFNHPLKYIFCNKFGITSLTEANLNDGKNGDLHISELNENWKNEKKLDFERDLMLNFKHLNACSVCPGWRICLSAFKEQIEENPGCTDFFTEMLDACEFYNKTRQNKPELCSL